MNKNGCTPYTLPAEAEKQFQQKFWELHELSLMYHVPIFATVVLTNDKERTTYFREVSSAGAHRICLKEDRIRKHMLIARGCETADLRNVPGPVPEPYRFPAKKP